MAIPFLNNITLNNNEIQNVRLQNGSSAPLNFGPGQIYFDSTADPGGTPPTYVQTAKYYSNATDTWVSLKEYSFPAGTYVTGALTGTTPKPIITFDLTAVDGDAAETVEGNGIRYLSKNNKWAEIASIPGTYKFTISDNASPTPVTGIVAEDDTVQIAANTDLTSNLTGQATTTKTLTIGLKVDSGLGNANNYVLNQGTEVATADDTIPFNDYTPGATPPSTQTNIVKKTTFGTIPVTALTEVKTYIDNAVLGGLIYQGGYDATLNSPDLTTSPNSILKGWTYTVTVGGTFFGEVLEVGDVLIAEVNDPSALTDWTTVQNNVDLANLTQVGIGNVNASALDNELGIEVVYASGTAKVGLDINGLTLDTLVEQPSDYFLPIYDAGSGINNKAKLSELLAFANSVTSFSGTIGNGSAASIRLEDSGAVAPNINHGLGTDSSSFMIQLVDVSSGETVYADVTRGASGLVTIDFAVAPAVNDIRVLIQKIG